MPGMSDIEEPGYAERDDDETTEQTGGGVGFDEPDEAAGSDEGADSDFEEEGDSAA
jgi:hypothetical protein